MPSSYVDSFAPIVKLLTEMAPTRIIDVGPGWGKYGLACREYLPGLETLHAVEVREGRLPTQDAIYDWVYTGDARQYQNTDFWCRWELVLLIDVIEHMTTKDGHQFLTTVLDAGCRVLVATPKIFVEQHDDTNPHEEHLSLWGWEDFQRYAVKRDVSTIDAVIYVLSK